MRVAFELTGISPLLMHADNVEMADVLEAYRKKMPKDQKKAGDDRSPAWSWHCYCYHDGEHLIWPAENMMTCLRDAGSRVTLKGKTTFKQLTQTGLLITEEDLELFTPHGKVSWEMICEWRENNATFMEQSKALTAANPDVTLFVKRAAVGNSKHVRVRPRFENWTIRGEMLVTSPDLTMEALQDIFDAAGNFIGLGGWRPYRQGGKSGPFGRFTAKLRKLK